MSATPIPFEVPDFLPTTAMLFGIICVRYFVFAGLLHYLFYRRGLLPHRKIRPEWPKAAIVRREIGWSLVTSVIFALSGACLLHLWKSGHTLMYGQVADYGWLWFCLSLPCLALLHETYFYWTHRWIHHKWLFRWVHRVHHDSRNPTPWAAFSFHPWEGLIQAIILPALVCVVPTHPVVLLTYLMVMTVFSVINHLGFELYPRGAEKTFWGRELISATHHFLHHHRARGNYGLYFTFWDRWMGTQALDTEDVYREVTEREPRPESLPKAA